jgi:hypothetical protein
MSRHSLKPTPHPTPEQKILNRPDSLLGIGTESYSHSHSQMQSQLQTPTQTHSHYRRLSVASTSDLPNQQGAPLSTLLTPQLTQFHTSHLPKAQSEWLSDTSVENNTPRQPHTLSSRISSPTLNISNFSPPAITQQQDTPTERQSISEDINIREGFFSTSGQIVTSSALFTLDAEVAIATGEITPNRPSDNSAHVPLTSTLFSPPLPMRSLKYVPPAPIAPPASRPITGGSSVSRIQSLQPAINNYISSVLKTCISSVMRATSSLMDVQWTSEVSDVRRMNTSNPYELFWSIGSYLGMKFKDNNWCDFFLNEDGVSFRSGAEMILMREEGVSFLLLGITSSDTSIVKEVLLKIFFLFLFMYFHFLF